MDRKNPFIIQREIGYGEPFCDREEEIATILASATRGEALCLISPRRFGKSSLMNQVLGRMIDQGWITIRLDLMEYFSLDDLAHELNLRRANALSLFERAKQAVKGGLKQVRPTMGIDPDSGYPTLSLDLSEDRRVPETRLREVLRLIAALPDQVGKPVCLALDEFQEVVALDPKRRIEGVIRGVFQKRSEGFVPMYLGSKRHMLRLMFEDESAPFYRSAKVIEIGVLSTDAFGAFMTKQFLISLDTQVPDTITNATCNIFGGHPYGLNKTACYLWTEWVAKRPASPDEIITMWKKVVLAIIREETKYYEVANQALPKYALRVLQRIAQDRVVHEPYSAAFARTCGLMPNQIQNALRILNREDKIIETTEGLRVQDPLEQVCLHLLGSTEEAREQALDRFHMRSQSPI